MSPVETYSLAGSNPITICVNLVCTFFEIEFLLSRSCFMLESRSPQLLDEGGELRIAWSKCSPAKSFCAKDIASPLKNYLLHVEWYAQSINANPPLSAIGQFRSFAPRRYSFILGIYSSPRDTYFTDG
jgi:hypothetical protein